MGERVKKSIRNAEVNLVFYFLTLFLTFFSRKIFLDNLGADFIGLTGTLNNILGYMNLAELGIGSCISFFLYKPLQENRLEEINELLSVFGYLYRCIGYIILIVGIIISLFFPFIFHDNDLGFGIVYFAFYSILASSLIGYFINYRQILLTADQKGYIVAIYFQSSRIVLIALQIYMALTFRNVYVWVTLEFLFSLLGCIVLNWKIDKEYPWLRTNKKAGKALLKKYPTILTNTRKIFIHKIKDFILNRSDELFVFLFASLKMVAYYGNYTMIVAKIGLLFSSVLDSTYAGVGNLIAEGNKQNIKKVFWELMAIRHFVAGFLCYSIYHFIEPFICIWLGPEYVLDHNILILLCAHIYISTSRGVVDMYNHSHGLYADVWAAWSELIINVVITIVAGYYLGIVGILLGKVASTLIIIVLWKPYYLFHSGLHESYRSYWNGAIRNYFVSFGCIAIAHYIITTFISINAANGYLSWITYSIVGILIYLILNLTLIILFCKGGRDCIYRIKNLVMRRR